MKDTTPRHLPVSLIPPDLRGYDAGDYAFDGNCIPDHRGQKYAGWRTDTFSVGVFRWELKSGSKSKLKRGKVIKRFSGPSSFPDGVYNAAHAYIEQLMREGEKADAK